MANVYLLIKQLINLVYHLFQMQPEESGELSQPEEETIKPSETVSHWTEASKILFVPGTELLKINDKKKEKIKNHFEIINHLQVVHFIEHFIRKTENGSLGWRISFNIQTTTKNSHLFLHTPISTKVLRAKYFEGVWWKY